MLRLVQKRMQQRKEVEAQVSRLEGVEVIFHVIDQTYQIKDDTSPTDRQRFMKTLSETDALYSEWQEWRRTKEVCCAYSCTLDVV